MPTFEGVDLTMRVDIDFEVFCGTCGTGLCHESSTRQSRNRGFAQVEVNACPNCIEEKNKEIDDLEYQIEKLTEELETLKVKE